MGIPNPSNHQKDSPYNKPEQLREILFHQLNSRQLSTTLNMGPCTCSGPSSCNCGPGCKCTSCGHLINDSPYDTNEEENSFVTLILLSVSGNVMESLVGKKMEEVEREGGRRTTSSSSCRPEN